MVKLGRDHPYHVLYQLFALKNGNRGKDGRVSSQVQALGGMQQTVDVDKIQAAAAMIERIARHPNR